MKIKSFADFKINKKILHAVVDMGFEAPSPIQSMTIPLLLSGKDVIGQAQTGTGKTAAFGIPIVEKITSRELQALIITPTRELAIQIAEEIKNIGKYKRINVLPIYGGQPIERQIRGIKRGIQVIVGTPGRILDHLQRKTLNLNKINIVVLDEADEMLDMGFIEDIENILSYAPQTRQTILFSATMPPELLALAKKYMNNPEYISVIKEQITVPTIEQYYFESKEKNKVEDLCQVIDMAQPEKALIFCRTKKRVDSLVENLRIRGYIADGLHGGLTQRQREKVMQNFRKGNIELLVATDVAARGLDIDQLSHVINFDIPQDPESYVHRIGRTGRAGRSGVAYTFITPEEYKHLRAIEKVIKQRVNRKNIPTVMETLENKKSYLYKRLLKLLEQEDNNKQVLDLLNELSGHYSYQKIALAALRLCFGDDNQESSNNGLSSDSNKKSDMVRLFLNIGKVNKIGPGDIARSIAEGASIPENAIGSIDIFDRFSFVEVPANLSEKVFQLMQGINLKGKILNIEPAKNRK
ncbi:MAG TPA: DEAD/DEAH box helicase [Clostridia bacterium]|nr:DEAD/DEAH box helicase [Clostridia bacterium]